MSYKLELKGSALVYALIIMSAVLIVLASMVQYIASQIKYSSYQASREESLQIAEAGVHFYRWYLAHEVEGKTSTQIRDFWQTGSPYGVGAPYEREYTDPHGAGIGKFSISVTPPDPNSTIVIVQSTGWTYKNPDSQRTVRVRFRRPSWSEYIVLANANIRFGDGTEVFGPLHSNGGIHFDGVAHNVVSSSVATYYDNDSDVLAWKDGVWTAWSGEYNSNMGSDVFLAGKEFPVSSKDFNGVTADLALMKSEAIAGVNGIYFGHAGNGQHIILKTDGTFKVRKVNGYNPFTNSIISYGGGWLDYSIPDNGVIFVEDNVWVEGQISNKRVTIAAADLFGGSGASIFIANDITYTNYDGSDVIGLVGQNNVEIIRDSENDLRVDAALLAQTGRVGRKYYSMRYIFHSPGGWGWYLCPCGNMGCEDHKDIITVYGAIATNQSYGFAWNDGCPRHTGYTNINLIYDNNLLYYPPPYFPTGTEYFLDLWDEL